MPISAQLTRRITSLLKYSLYRYMSYRIFSGIIFDHRFVKISLLLNISYCHCLGYSISTRGKKSTLTVKYYDLNLVLHVILLHKQLQISEITTTDLLLRPTFSLQNDSVIQSAKILTTDAQLTKKAHLNRFAIGKITSKVARSKMAQFDMSRISSY